jgi:cyanate lyase
MLAHRLLRIASFDAARRAAGSSAGRSSARLCRATVVGTAISVAAAHTGSTAAAAASVPALMSRDDATAIILASKAAAGTTWAVVASRVGLSPVWTVSAALGQQTMSKMAADRLCEAVGVPSGQRAAVSAALQSFARKGGWVMPGAASPSNDPLLYRLHEIQVVFGPAIKELIHEQFGDGIMSAVDFEMEVRRVNDDKGVARVQIVMTGKYLPYRVW